MGHAEMKLLVSAAFGGMLAGLSACGGAEPPAAAAAPSGSAAQTSRHSCGATAGEQHACGSEHEHEEHDAGASETAPK